MPVYLDANATTQLLPAAREAMLEALALPMNPSSLHAAGREAKRVLESARKTIADTVSAFPNEVIFTGSGTESNALALHGLAQATHVLVGATEHSSVLAARADAALLPVDAQGVLDIAALDAALAALPEGAKPLVSVMLANNETGVIAPIAEIAARVHATGGWLHVDAAQALGKIPVDMGLLGADALTLCAHKLGGPVGAGALVLRAKIPLVAQLRGGGQELRRRAGTENIAAIAGFAAAVKHAPSLAEHRHWLDALEDALMALDNRVRVAGKGAPRLPNTSCITMPGVSNETQLMHFDLGGVALSAGAACSSGRVEASHVLRAMGWDEAEARTAIRISTGWHSTALDVEQCGQLWRRLHARSCQPAA